MTDSSQQPLAQVIEQAYGLTNVKLTPALRGFVAETYTVDADQDTRYFAKWTRMQARYTRNLVESLSVLLALHQLGFDRISYPIQAVSGGLVIDPPQGGTLVLYNHIDARWTFEYSFTDYVDLLSRIHAVTADVEVPIKREDFLTTGLTEVRAYLKQVEALPDDAPEVHRIMRTELLPYFAEFEKDLDEYEALSVAMNQRTFETMRPVITHGDAPGNIMVADDGTLYMIDWDDLLLAPPERDTWFHVETPDGWALFLRYYRERFPDYELDEEVYRFYLLRRYIEDLDGSFDKILDPQSDDETRWENLKNLRKDCFGWLRPLVRRRES
jgi:spectinomycin phosphotransferase